MIHVVIAALVAGVLSAVLAALLVLAQRYLVNYGKCKIDINDGSHTLEVEGGESLLSSLMAEDIFIPSACGGRGTCAYCKVTVGAGAAVTEDLPTGVTAVGVPARPLGQDSE